jgi:hypothetical protein
MPTSTPLTLSRAARAELESLARSHRGRADEARRARIILLLAGGHSYSTICWASRRATARTSVDYSLTNGRARLSTCRTPWR